MPEFSTQCGEALAGLVEHVAGMHHAALDGSTSRSNSRQALICWLRVWAVRMMSVLMNLLLLNGSSLALDGNKRRTALGVGNAA